MGLSYPGALAFFALVPLLLAAYLVRERPARVVVSSVLGYRALRGLRAERPWGLPRLNWLFLLELLILSLVVLAMAGPYTVERHVPVALVIDDSAAMQARMGDGPSRFEAARERLLETALPAGDEISVTLFATAPQPHALASGLSPARARAMLLRMRPLDAPVQASALAKMLSDLLSARRFAEIYFASSRPLQGAPPPHLHLLAVGNAELNYALGSFELGPEALGSAGAKGSLALANFSPRQAQLQVAVAGLNPDGSGSRTLAHAQATLAAGEIGTLEFHGLPPAAIYRATLSPQDGLMLDNTAYATAQSSSLVDVLFVSPRPQDAAGLESIPGLRVRTVSPQDYSPQSARADLLIFEYAVPKELPAANVLLVEPPAGDPLFEFHLAAGKTTQIATWRSPDPITDGVNFQLLILPQPESFGPHPWMTPVVGSNDGSLILEGEHEGHRYLALGFNPFPYLGARNLPMSILTLNLLSYLSGFGAVASGFKTAQAWPVPAGVHDVIAPDGAKMAVKPGTLFAATTQGVYQLIGPGTQRRLRAVNLDDFKESDLENQTPLKLEAPPAAGAPANFSERKVFTPYLLLLILALATLDALIAFRRRRQGLPAGVLG